jgi:hypothetical protein
MTKLLVLLATLATTSALVACGGGGSAVEEPTAGSADIPAAVAGESELLVVTATEWEFDPKVFQFKAGNTYRLQMLNRAEVSLRLNIPLWNILLFAQAGKDSMISPPFTVEADANETECYERLQGAKHSMYCYVEVSP